MRVIDTREQATWLDERKQSLGLDEARFAAARNSGVARTPQKRWLLRVLEETARRQGRTQPFIANH